MCLVEQASSLLLLTCHGAFTVIKKQNSLTTLLGTASIAVLTGLAMPAQAGKITGTIGKDGDITGWNMQNVDVATYTVDGTATTIPYNEGTGTYDPEYSTFDSNIYDDVGGAGSITAILHGKDYPVGEPPGLKVVNGTDPTGTFSNGKPTSCIMTTSYLDGGFLDDATPQKNSCDGPFQSHKRFKINMMSLNPIDLVFNVEADAADPVTRSYQIFQKINNYTGSRLQGFTVQVGTGGAGAPFVPAGTGAPGSETGALIDNLYLSIPTTLWPNDDDIATFSSGLFGPLDPPHFPTKGFFDDVRAGFTVDLLDDPDTDAVVADGSKGYELASNTVLPSNYSQSPPTGPTTQFGEWIHSAWQPYGIFWDDDNDPSTDAVLVAFWGDTDGAGNYAWMRGENNDVAAPTAPSWDVIDPAIISAYLADPAYSIGQIEDLLNLGLNFIVSVGDVNDAAIVAANDTFTIRITPIAAATNDEPGYVTNQPSFSDVDGVVLIGPNPVDVGVSLALRVNDAITGAPATVNITIENLSTGETETVTLDKTLDGIYQGTLSTSGDATNATNDSGALYVAEGDTIQASYVDPADATDTDTSTTVVATTPVTPPPSTTTSSSSSGGCVAGTGSPWNITMPAILIALLGYGLIRRRKQQ
jgi:hypothetical protein